MLGQRLRDGHVGPGGYVDMLTNDTEGAMLKLEPAD